MALLQNLLNPPVLFFFLGLLAVAVRSDLSMPQQIAKFLSLYLLFSLGIKGGIELSKSHFSSEVFQTLSFAVLMAFLVPVMAFFVFRKLFSVYDAGGLAAAYGSVSAVTFIAATGYLQTAGIVFGGHMVAALALMESPAIIVGVLLVRKYAKDDNPSNSGFSRILHESFTNGSVMVLLGSLMIGYLTGEKAEESLSPFYQGIFKGMLCLFLLDMGLLAGRRISALGHAGIKAISLGILLPLVNAVLAVVFVRMMGISEGDGLLLTVLCASASYIAVPAAISLAVPQANPGVYIPMALAVTFPFNILVGIPLYHSMLNF